MSTTTMMMHQRPSEATQSQRRAAKVDAAVRFVMNRGPCPQYAGDQSVQVKPDFFRIDEPEPVERRKPQTAPFPARPATKSKIRDGAHVGHLNGVNPLLQARLDPLAEQLLKVKDPVAYHVYRNQRPWVTQSSLIGEHLRTPAPPGTRVPQTPGGPSSPNKRETLRMLRASGPRAVGDNAAPGDMEAVSPTRGGYIPTPARQPGDMMTLAQMTFVNPKMHPEPKTCKAPKAADRIFYSKHPTDTSARDAVDNMTNFDGTLKAERPDKVHPSVWLRAKTKEKSLSLDDPHAHKNHAPGWMGTIGGSTIVK